MARGERAPHPAFVDMTGQRVGRLVVLFRAPNVNGEARWHCRCDCGGERIVKGIKLRDAAKRGRTTLGCNACAPKRTQRRRANQAAADVYGYGEEREP